MTSSNFDIIPAPIYDPTAAAINIANKVTGSTFITVVNINASHITGKQQPTFKNPGSSLSFIPILKNLLAATIIANDPIPNVSKKFAIHPKTPTFATDILSNLFDFFTLL